MRWFVLRPAAACFISLTLTLAPAAFGCVFSHAQYKEGDELCFRHVHLQCGEMGNWKQLPRCDKDTVTLPPPAAQRPPGAPAGGVTPAAATPPAAAAPAPATDKNR